MSSLLLGLLRSPASSRRRAREKAPAENELVEKHNEGVELKPLSLTPRTACADEPTSPKELGLGPLPQVESAPEVAEPLEVAAAPTRSPPPVAEPLPVQPQPPASHWPESAESQFVLRYLSASHDASVDISPLIRTGFLLCKLLSAAIPGSLDERAINTGSGSAANSPRSGVGAAGGRGGRAAGEAAEVVIGVGGEAGGADGATLPGAAWAGVVAAACRPGALGGLTAEEAEENCQLCRSCATAQGCDVAGIAPEALQAGEAGAVTEFVLEVLRQSAVQALPPGQRQWLVPPPQPAPTALVTAGPRARARAGGAAAGAGAHATVSGTSSAIAEAPLAATTAPGPGPAQAAPHTAPCGTTAARRAVSGLQHWAASRLAGAPGGSADEAQEQGQEPDVGAGAAVDGAALLATPAAWSRLADCVVSAQEAMQAPAPGPGPGPGQGSGLVAAEQPGAAVGTSAELGDGGGAENEWEAAATALDRALRAALPAPPCGACAPALPPLRPEYLRSPHAGLRSALLAHVLLACTSAAASAAASTAVASATEGQARCGVEGQDAEGATGRHSEQAPVQQEAGGDLVSGPLSCHLTLGEGGFDGAASADSGAVSPSAAAVSASATATAAAVMQPPPASPAPPLPADVRQRQTSGGGGGAAGGWGGHPHLRGVRSLGPPADMLSEHNKLVAWEHQQRQLRRQQRSMGSGGAGDGGPVGEGAAGDGFGGGGGGGLAKAGSRSASRSELWGGEAEDLEGDSQEERVLRLWLNSLDPGRLHVGSLFDREVATGWPLLLALDAIQPGCVTWADTFRPPFKEKLHKILSVQNCNQVVALCGGRLGLPHLVNIGGLDLALGQRRAILSLVFQMMHHHTGMVLGLLAPSSTPTTTSASPTPRSPCAAAGASSPASTLPQPAHAPSGQPRGAGGVGSSSGGGSSAASPRHTHLQDPQQQQQLQHQLQHHFQQGQQGQQGQWHGHPRPHVEVEKAVIAWANAKLTAAAEAAAAANGSSAAEGKVEDEASNAVAPAAVSVAPTMPFTPLSGFSDPRLAEGQVLLQLLAAISPRAVSAKYVLPGHDAGERESNAKYLLSCARKIGCVIFLGWEDVLSARPRLLLLLLTSFMAHDRKREAAAGFIQ